MNAEIAELQHRLLTDTPFFAEHCLTIRNEDRQEVRLKPRPWQARTPETSDRITPLDEAIDRQMAAGRPVRILIGKARKLGFSTWTQAKFMQRVAQRQNEYALNVAHRQDAGGQLFDMAYLMYERLPSDHELGEMIYGPGSGRMAPFSVKPQYVGGSKTRGGGRWMALGDRQRSHAASVYETMTAGSKGGGRASTPSMVHLSEAAHYEDPDFIVGILNAVPKRPGTIVIIESTANGFNHFYDRWVRAAKGEEDEAGGLYERLFYGWQDNPYNRLEFMSSAARDRFEQTIGDESWGGDEEEPWLLEAFDVSLEQLYWRRVTRDEECNGDIELFHQEHPATPEQMFIGSGRPVFPGILVAKMIKAAENAPAPVEGVVRGMDWVQRKTRSGSVDIPQRAIWVPEDGLEAVDIDRWPLGERLHVWEMPFSEQDAHQSRVEYDAAQRRLQVIEESARTAATEAEQEMLREVRLRGVGQYILFADVAQGEGTSSDDRDYNVIQVLDHISRMQVARYRSRVPVHELPLLVYLVGLFYNEATVAPEKTGIGIGVVDALAKDYRYRRMYRTQRAGDDQRADPRESLVGWETTLRTKPMMEQTFGLALKEGGHGCRDVATAREATTYVEDPKRPAKHGAQPGTHDDLLMALMGAHRVASETRPRTPKGAGRVGGRQVGDPLTDY